MIAIRADGNENIGMGHLMRCMCIADELVSRGEKVVFVVAPDCEESIFASKGYEYHKLTGQGVNGWDSREAAHWLQDIGCDKILMDSYRVTEEDFEILSKVAFVAYLDDLCLFDHACDALINYNIEATEELYSNHKKTKQTYLGPKYFPLREEFCLAENSDIKEDVRNVLITTGSIDDAEIALHIAEALAPKHKDILFQILVGKFYAPIYKEALQRLAQTATNVELLPWGQNMAALFQRVDLVISPGSTTIFEALSMNVPCISFEFADNQHGQCIAMDELGMVPYVGGLNDLSIEKMQKLEEVFAQELIYPNRQQRALLFGKYLDKKGTKRIGDILLGDC